MGPSESFEKTVLLETKVTGMKVNASARINILEEEPSPVPESAQCEDPTETTETADVNHENEKQIVEYVAHHSAKELTAEPNSDSHKDQADKIEEFANAAVTKPKVSDAAEKKLKPLSRVINGSLLSSHPSYPKHTYGPSAEAVKAVLDLVFLDSKGSVVYKNSSLLSETRASVTKLLAAKAAMRKRNPPDEKRDPDVDIIKGYEVNEQDRALRDLFFLDYWYDPDVEIVEGYKANDHDTALRDLFFLDWCEGFALAPETHGEGTKLISSEIEKLGEKRDADVDIEEGCEEDEHGKHARDLALLDSETTEYKEKSLAVKSHAKGTELLASEIELLDEMRDPTADIDEACELNEQSQRERDLVSQDSERKGHEEVHAKKTLNVESRKGHSFDDKRGRGVDCDEAYEVNELVPAFPNLLVGLETATKLLGALIESRKSQSVNEKRDPGIDLDAGYEGDERKTVLSGDCESAISFPSDKAAATEGLLIAPTSDEDIMIISTLDEDAIIVNDELSYMIDRKLTAMFEEDKQLIPASKELLLLYHILKAMIAEHKNQEGSASSPRIADACQLGAPLEAMQDLQEWVSERFSPKYLCACT